MTQQPPPSGGDMSAWEHMFRDLFGPDADEALRMLRERGVDPAAIAAAQGISADPAALQQVLAEVQRMLSASGQGPVNWDVAREVARRTAAVGGDPVVTAADERRVADAFSAAELWLDVVTDLPPAGGGVRALSRASWVEQTMPAWRRLTEPVADALSSALADALSDRLPDDLAAAWPAALGDVGEPGVPPDPRRLVQQLGSAVFGMQLGQAAGTLAREAFGLTDLGLPLVREPVTALVPANVQDFADGLDAPADEVRAFLALREAAHARLFTHVAWLRSHLLGAVDAYARGIRIDVDQLTQAVEEIDPSDPGALQAALSSGVFAPQTTPEQRAALTRLETALALVEGWVEEVTATAAAPHLPHAVPLREMMRRRRAAGGPAEQTFATLVGLELRPRRSRDAAALWAQIARESGPGARDGVWAHPDLLPGAEDLDDVAGYAARRAAASAEDADVDRALAEMLDEGEPPQSAAPDDPGDPGDPGDGAPAH